MDTGTAGRRNKYDVWDFYMSMLTLLDKIRQLRGGEIDRETLNHWAEQEEESQELRLQTRPVRGMLFK